MLFKVNDCLPMIEKTNINVTFVKIPGKAENLCC